MKQQLPIITQDPGRVGASIGLLDEQLIDGWRQLHPVDWPERYGNVNRIVVAGMGGSHLAADIVRSVLADTLPHPIEIVADYRLPSWVNRQTLVVCSSYSGSTEETIEALKMAVKRRLPVVALCTGGKLADSARYYKLPLLQFTPAANPSGQPRLALGYGIAGMLAILQKLGWLHGASGVINQLQTTAKSAAMKYGPSRVKNNPARELAHAWKDRLPYLFGMSWMAGNLHTFANQLHENAKTLAEYDVLPDLNHHLLEGLRNRRLTRLLHTVLFDDQAAHPRNRKRLSITAKLLTSLGAATTVIKLPGKTRWDRSIELLTFGSYVSWYLAAERRVKPAPIPTVDQLKAALASAR